MFIYHTEIPVCDLCGRGVADYAWQFGGYLIFGCLGCAIEARPAEVVHLDSIDT